MKKKWTNNIGMKVLSVVLAFVVWIIIVNIEDPTTSRTFRVPVEILNEKVVESEGKVYHIKEGSEVDVTVTANKSFVDSLKASDIRATADLSHLSFTNSTPIEPECTKYSTSKVDLQLGKVKTLVVELEEKAEERFPIRFNIVGKVPEGFYVSASLMKSSPSMITVSDGVSFIKKISQVAVEVNVNKRTNDFKVTLEPKAYNSDGEIIVSDNLSFSVDKVDVKVQVLPTKTVPINLKIKGTPAYGYEWIEAKTGFEPNQILIAGKQEYLDACDSIDLEVDINGATGTLDTVIELNQDVLPENIIVADSNTNVAVEVQIQKMKTKEFNISLQDISVKLPTGITTYSFVDPTKTYKISVLAPSDKIKDITIDTLQPTIDLSDKKYGTHSVKLQFASDYDVTVLEDDIVDIVLTDPNEIQPTSSPTQGPEETVSPTETPVPDVTEE